jgi:predicted N-acyltransferase
VPPPEVEIDYCMQLAPSLTEVDAAAWNAVLAADGSASPFLRHEFLHALEASGCVGNGSGWTPQHLLLTRGAALVGMVPLYLKSHSYGEYVFDWSWAEAYHRSGLEYYPKWLAAVPFTPVGGSRLIAVDAPARAALAQALVQLARDSGLSSLHLLLAPPAQIELLRAQGCVVRQGVQFHWRNARFADFEQFLAALAQPKRKKIRAERRKVQEAGVTLERKCGAAITERDWAFFNRCYRNTYAEHGSTPYLNLDFFLRLGQALPQHLLLVLAQRAGQPIAASLAVYDHERLYGRYWGAVEAVPCLHFECCYYQPIEFAIERGLQLFEGGAQGAHKLARGLDPVPTYSAHWLAQPQMHAAVARFAAREAEGVAATLDELNEHRAWHAAQTDATKTLA